MCRIICIHWHFVCIYEFIRTWYCCCTNLFTNYLVKLSVCVSLIWSNWILTNNWSLCLTWLLLATSRLAIASPITWTGINYLGFVLIILVKLLFSFLGDWLAIVPWRDLGPASSLELLYEYAPSSSIMNYYLEFAFINIFPGCYYY